MITTSAWVRRGVAAQFPTKYDIDEKEMDRISKLARMQLEDAQEDLSAAQGNGDSGNKDDDDAMEEDDTEEKAEKKDASKKTTWVHPFCRLISIGGS